MEKILKNILVVGVCFNISLALIHFSLSQYTTWVDFMATNLYNTEYSWLTIPGSAMFGISFIGNIIIALIFPFYFIKEELFWNY